MWIPEELPSSDFCTEVMQEEVDYQAGPHRSTLKKMSLSCATVNENNLSFSVSHNKSAFYQIDNINFARFERLNDIIQINTN